MIALAFVNRIPACWKIGQCSCTLQNQNIQLLTILIVWISVLLYVLVYRDKYVLFLR